MRIPVEGTCLFIEAFGQQHAFTGAEMAARPTLKGLHAGPGVNGITLRHHLAIITHVPTGLLERLSPPRQPRRQVSATVQVADPPLTSLVIEAGQDASGSVS